MSTSNRGPAIDDRHAHLLNLATTHIVAVAARLPTASPAVAPVGDVLLTIKDIATACRLSETAVRRAITDGELPAVKLRSRMRITRENFNAWIVSQRQPSPARQITPLRTATRAARPAPAGSFRAIVQADAAKAAGAAQPQAR